MRGRTRVAFSLTFRLDCYPLSRFSVPSSPNTLYPSLTPYKRRLQAGHADGWGLGGPHTEDVDQIPQIPNSGSNPLEETLKGPGSNLAGGATRGGRS